jgi:eukaryotic-like serine/threonine-protein kinase
VTAHAASCSRCGPALAALRAAPLAATEHRPLPAVAPTRLASPPSSTPSAAHSLPAERPAPPPAQVVVGDVVDGKYLVEAVLGEGGMGQVLAATHLQLRQQVALKFMTRATVGHPEAMARFVREARAAARLRSEHVCRVLDMGEAEGGVPYIVIEYLEGEDLGQLLARRGKLPPREAIGHVLHACEGMAEAHGHGIVHRDLKPGNLFLAAGPTGRRVKVLDFGISKLVGAETEAGVTTTRALMGSPLYMAPEQLMSAKDVDARADVWALGVVLYELVSGTTPFKGDNLPSLVTQVLHAPPRPLAEVAPEVPRELRAIITRCMDREPKKRYADAAELGAALRALRLEDDRQLSAPDRAASRRLLWAAAVAALLIGGAAAAWVARGGDRAEPAGGRPPTAPAAAAQPGGTSSPIVAPEADAPPGAAAAPGGHSGDEPAGAPGAEPPAAGGNDERTADHSEPGRGGGKRSGRGGRKGAGATAGRDGAPALMEPSTEDRPATPRRPRDSEVMEPD